MKRSNLSDEQLQRAAQAKESFASEVARLKARQEVFENMPQTLDWILHGDREMSPNGAGRGRGRGRPKKRVMSLESRAKIAAAQKERWAKERSRGKAFSPHARMGNKNNQMPPWTPKHDAIIVNAVKLAMEKANGPVDPTALADKLQGKLKRTRTAIRQRIGRLAKKEGSHLKETHSKSGVKNMVEVV